LVANVHVTDVVAVVVVVVAAAAAAAEYIVQGRCCVGVLHDKIFVSLNSRHKVVVISIIVQECICIIIVNAELRGCCCFCNKEKKCKCL